MIDAFCAVIVPELAFGTVVVCRVHAAIGARGAGGLRGTTEHAQHVPCHFTIESVGKGQIWRRVVAVSTWMPLVAVEALNLDIPAVVRTSQTSTFVVDVVRTVAGLKVLWGDVVWVVV